MNIKKIHSDRAGHFVLEFDKKNSLSFSFSSGSHTDNQTLSRRDLSLTFGEWLGRSIESTTLEIMPFGNKLFKICSEYEEYWDETLLNYFPVEKLMELLNKIKELK